MDQRQCLKRRYCPSAPRKARTNYNTSSNQNYARMRSSNGSLYTPPLQQKRVCQVGVVKFDQFSRRLLINYPSSLTSPASMETPSEEEVENFLQAVNRLRIRVSLTNYLNEKKQDVKDLTYEVERIRDKNRKKQLYLYNMKAEARLLKRREKEMKTFEKVIRKEVSRMRQENELLLARHFEQLICQMPGQVYDNGQAGPACACRNWKQQINPHNDRQPFDHPLRQSPIHLQHLFDDSGVSYPLRRDQKVSNGPVHKANDPKQRPTKSCLSRKERDSFKESIKSHRRVKYVGINDSIEGQSSISFPPSSRLVTSQTWKCEPPSSDSPINQAITREQTSQVQAEDQEVFIVSKMDFNIAQLEKSTFKPTKPQSLLQSVIEEQPNESGLTSNPSSTLLPSQLKGESKQSVGLGLSLSKTKQETKIRAQLLKSNHSRQSDVAVNLKSEEDEDPQILVSPPSEPSESEAFSQISFSQIMFSRHTPELNPEIKKQSPLEDGWEGVNQSCMMKSRIQSKSISQRQRGLAENERLDMKAGEAEKQPLDEQSADFNLLCDLKMTSKSKVSRPT